MSSRRLVAVIFAMMAGTLIGGVGHAAARADARACEETSPGWRPEIAIVTSVCKAVIHPARDFGRACPH